MAAPSLFRIILQVDDLENYQLTFSWKEQVGEAGLASRSGSQIGDLTQGDLNPSSCEISNLRSEIPLGRAKPNFPTCSFQADRLKMATEKCQML